MYRRTAQRDSIAMPKVPAATLIALLACGPVMAQPAANRAPPSSQKPVDHGPFTPEASSAYQGGGVVLQGAPGAPPPTPQPTPPGQTPAHMVKP
jgi:hypothetical protein